MNLSWKTVLLISFFILSYSCPKNQTLTSAPAPDPAQLKQKLEWVELGWEILQKDNPSLIETTQFRMNLAEAKKALVENKLAVAEAKLEEAEFWLSNSRERYYGAHLEDLRQGRLKENPALLWQKAEEFWAKERECFLAGDKDRAELFGKAGMEQAEVAVTASLYSELLTKEKVDYCLKLKQKQEERANPIEAEKWKEQALNLIRKRIDLIFDQAQWCLSGTIPACDSIKIRESQENYLKAKKILEDSQIEIKDLAQLGNQISANSFSFPALLEAQIQGWVSKQESYFEALPKLVKPAPIKDYNAQLKEEQEKQRETVKRYNQLYCPLAEDLKNFGLEMEETEIKLEDNKLILRIRLSNNNPFPIYRTRIRICGGVVSEELALKETQFPGQYQTSFSLSAVGFSLEPIGESEYEIASHWGLVIFEDAQGKIYQGRAILKP